MGVVFNPFTGNFDFVSEAFRTIIPTTGTNIVADAQKDTITLTSSTSTIIADGNGTTDTLDLRVNTALFPSASFTTIATPAGISPIADAVADTLTFLAGTGLTITGSDPDTITFNNTINIDEVLTNGNSTTGVINFTDDLAGLTWNIGSHEARIYFDTGQLIFADANDSVDLILQTNNISISPTNGQTNVSGIFNFISGSDIQFESGGFTSKIEASGTDLLWSKISVGSPNLIMGIPIRMQNAIEFQVRDADLSINSSTDGQMDFAADVKILATTPHFQVSNDFEVGATGSFSSSVVINEGGNDADTRIESNDEANMFYVDAGNNRIGIGTATPTEVLGVRGNIALETAGNGIQIKEGSNARMGLAALVAGTATVSNTSVTASTRIFLSRNLTGGTVGHLSTTISAGTSFTINSTSATDTSRIVWFLMEPA